MGSPAVWGSWSEEVKKGTSVCYTPSSASGRHEGWETHASSKCAGATYRPNPRGRLPTHNGESVQLVQLRLNFLDIEGYLC
jgi:hypothetical protein